MFDKDDIMEHIRSAMEEFEESLDDSTSVKNAFLLLDTIASALQDLFPHEFPDDDEELAPDEVFEKLTKHGLKKDSPKIARTLGKLASRNWYDNDSEKEKELLGKAEYARERLFDRLSSFIDKIKDVHG